MAFDADPPPSWADSTPGQQAVWPATAATPVASSPEERSAWITTSAVILFVVAALSGLAGVLLLVFGLVIGPAFGEIMDAAREPPPGFEAGAAIQGFEQLMVGLMVGFAIVALLWMAAHIAAGVGLLGGRLWARITAIVLAVLGLLLTGFALISTLVTLPATIEMANDPEFREFVAGPGATESAVIAGAVLGLLFIVPFVVGYVIVLVTMIRSGSFFERRPAA